MHQEHGAPLAGTGTVVMAEGRRLIRLGRELSSPIFDALINEYQRLTRDVMERMGGREFEVFQDTAIAAFPTAKQAALAAAALQHVVAIHEWPHKGDVAVSVGVHTGDVGIGLGPATICCEALCDAAEGGDDHHDHHDALGPFIGVVHHALFPIVRSRDASVIAATPIAK